MKKMNINTEIATDHMRSRELLPRRNWCAYLLACALLVLFATLNGSSQVEKLRLRLNATPKQSANHGLTVRNQTHSNCFIRTMFKNSGEFLYKNTTYYKLSGNNSAESIRYDHLCPFLLKDRYNCATKRKFVYGGNAYDWKLVLRDQGKEEHECNLWNLVQDLEGPAGIGKRMLYDREQTRQGGGGDLIKHSSNQTMINVAIFGNSYLRQIFESLLCTWSNELSFSLFEKDGGYDVSLAAMKLRNNTPLTFDELGKMEPIPNPNDTQCHQISELKQFYEDGLETPRKCKGYTDNLAVAEFGGSMRIYYSFRPYFHQNLTRVLKEKLNMIPEKIDVLVFNDGQSHIIEKDAYLLEAFRTSGAWNNRIEWDYKHFRTIQERDIGQWFGSNNPWIEHPPDDHACMPGPPDDEVNLLLYLIYTNSFIRT